MASVAKDYLYEKLTPVYTQLLMEKGLSRKTARKIARQKVRERITEMKKRG